MKVMNRKWFRHYKIKIFSLLCALFLWLYVVSDNVFEYTFDVPIRLVNQPKDRILSQPFPEVAKVQFKGTGKAFLNFSYRNRCIELDLFPPKSYYRFPLSVDMIKGIPTGIEITPIRIVGPDSVTIRLDQFAVKNVPIHSNITLIPMDGYIQVGDVVFQPDSLLISGPVKWVSAVSAVETQEKVYQSVFKKIVGKINLQSPASGTINFSTNSVHFQADVQRIGERIVSDVPIRVLFAPPDLKVTVVPSTLTLKLQGGVDLLRELPREKINASIDYGNRSRYTGYGIPATIKLPKDIVFSEVKPKFFELVIER